MKNILILSFFSDFKRDPRVFRQIKLLKTKYSVSTVGLKSAELDDVKFYHIEPTRSHFSRRIMRSIMYKMKLFEKIYWGTYKFDNLLKMLSRKKFDLIIANDIDSLPFALKIAHGAKIIFDAHEYYPREAEDNLLWKIFFQEYRAYLCRRYIKYCDKMITVSEGIGEEYYKNFGVRPVIIMNAPDYVDIKPTLVEGKHIQMIHHGFAIPGRKIELVIEMMSYLDDRFNLNLMLHSPSSNYQRYLDKLRALAKEKKNIHFLEPVPMQDIVKSISKYDLGVYILEPSNFNNAYALPNKFFEFIQARLAVAIGPSPEMARLVKRYDCGIVTTDFNPKTMASALNNLTPNNINYYKNNAHKAAHELSSIPNMEKLENIVSALLR